MTTLENNNNDRTQVVSAPYDQNFFKELADYSRRSAAAVVPLILELLHPKSVVDIGCGTGIWLDEFGSHGVTDFHGVDGAYALDAELCIPRERFTVCDLEAGDPQLNKQFDMALSLEVAEHLSPSRASGFVSLLCRLAPVIVFSAAIPLQTGTNHINEQWPFYWEDLFLAEGFVQLDLLRPRLWQNPMVAFWYQQNTFVYATKEQAQGMRTQASIQSEDKCTRLHLVQEEVIRRLEKRTLELTDALEQTKAALEQTKALALELTKERESPGLRQLVKLQLRMPVLALHALQRRIGTTRS
jgi:SAM-dependent methyltransferase